MSEFVTDDGEVLDYATAKAKAKSSIATFKFELLETVRGDPRLSAAPPAWTLRSGQPLILR
ncbi:hypothetical protein [Brucella anthropi]|uniref:hypothetical protein n=1 Tax=Brucella anthropi TaxID=529 RepID=UPI00236135E8|nr:hypothetical protein [Brucella anthropi]